YATSRNNKLNAMTTPDFPSSPPWSASAKRAIVIILLAILALALYRIRVLLLPLITAVILAYLVAPLVQFITRRARLRRGWAIALVYLVILAALVSIPVSAISPIVSQVNNFINNLPHLVEQLGELLQQPIVIAGNELPLNQVQIEQIYASLSANFITLVQTIGSQSLTVFGSIASATLSTFGWTFLVLFLSFYLVKDHDQLFRAILNLTPETYQSDLLHLSRELQLTWNAFLRGQLVLSGVMGLIIFSIALILNLPNALLLALIASVMEFLPSIGPVLAAVPAILSALFQSQTSWVGGLMSPFWFAVLIVGIYGLVFQLENYYLIPRIMGRRLQLHPLVVILGALAGASVAGLLGILLAAPTLATARLFILYAYAKLTDQPFFAQVEDDVRETAVVNKKNNHKSEEK
ncbi:MAG: AI-2E family transporter, partial [Chloroflexi bacterium]|nr:AI-2E family transporter [Chloroflexota bacterium]